MYISGSDGLETGKEREGRETVVRVAGEGMNSQCVKSAAGLRRVRNEGDGGVCGRTVLGVGGIEGKRCDRHRLRLVKTGRNMDDCGRGLWLLEEEEDEER